MKIAIFGGFTLLTASTLFAQNADQRDLDALKSRMDQMQKRYEQRIEKMDQERAQDRQQMNLERAQDKQQISELQAEIRALQSKAASSSSILNTRVLTDANGTEAPGKAPAPMLDESFLKSLTRNFTFNMYSRAGFMFNGNGGAGAFNFEAPDNPGGRWRLGNENDFYVEPSFTQAHILGDSTDVADVSLRFTTSFGFINGVFHKSFLNTGTASDFQVGLREAYSEMKNVFHAAPEITFWAGQRLYDRWDYYSNDWFWLDTSGFGIGAYNIHLGPGNLWVAWIGSNQDNLNLLTNQSQFNSLGDQFEQTFDVRYRDWDIGFGKLNLVAIANYAKGGVLTPNRGQTFTNVLRATDTVNVSSSDAYGAGGGIIWQYVYGNRSYFRVFGLFGWGLTNFSAENTGNSLPAFEQGVNGFVTGKSQPNVHETAPGVFTGSINPYRASHQFRAGIDWVWNVTECFSNDLWAYWDENNVGFTLVGTNAAGKVFTAAKTRDFFGVGFRPVYWLWDNFAIQGQAGYAYVSNVRGYSGTGTAFGNHGNWGILTIAPTIKPKGGYYTKPELRIFATWSRWSNSLRGTTTQGTEGFNFGPSSPPYNSVHTNQGWLIGSQLEIWY